MNCCLEEAGVGPEELDLVAFSDKPLLKFDRILEAYASFAQIGFKLFLTHLRANGHALSASLIYEKIRSLDSSRHA